MGVRDWSGIKGEYVTTAISLSQLAQKHSVSLNTLKHVSAAEHWPEHRKDHRKNVETKTMRKVQERTSAKCADKLLQLQSSADLLSGIIEQILSDERQFHRHLVKTRNRGLADSDAKGAHECWDVEQREFDKVDTKAVRELAAALKDVASVVRNVYDLPTKAQASMMKMAAGRLEMNKKKSEEGGSGSGALRVEFENEAAEELSK